MAQAWCLKTALRQSSNVMVIIWFYLKWCHHVFLNTDTYPSERETGCHNPKYPIPKQPILALFFSAPFSSDKQSENYILHRHLHEGGSQICFPHCVTSADINTSSTNSVCPKLNSSSSSPTVKNYSPACIPGSC